MKNYTWKDLFKDYLNNWPVFILWLIMLIPAFYYGQIVPLLMLWLITTLEDEYYSWAESVLTNGIFWCFMTLTISIFMSTFIIHLLNVRIYKKSGKKGLPILMSVIFIIVSIFINFLMYLSILRS